jgi:serine/threonine protein phosphatase PrpC
MRQRPLEFSAASASSQGARPYQEDCTRLWYPDGAGTNGSQNRAVLAVLADGMGGHVSGEVASKLVCEECVQHFSAKPGDLEDKIATVLHASNASLERAILSNSSLSGMGCTLVAAYLDRDGVRWASVGDSALLLFRGDQLYRLNDDHSLGALLDKQAAANLITYEEAHNSPNRHGLRSALTGSPIAITDVAHSPQAVLPADWVILCSDGLEALTGDEIATIIGNSRDGTPAELVRELLDEVGRRALPNQDNTSVVAVRIHVAEDDTAEPPDPRGVRGIGADTSGSGDAPDTEVMIPKIGGVLVGRVNHDKPAAPTVLIRRRRGSSWPMRIAAAAALLLVAASSAVLVSYYMLAPDSKATGWEPVTQQVKEPAVQQQQPVTQQMKEPAPQQQLKQPVTQPVKEPVPQQVKANEKEKKVREREREKEKEREPEMKRSEKAGQSNDTPAAHQ